MNLDIDTLIKENNALVEEIDELEENDDSFSVKYYEYIKLRKLIKLNIQAEKKKEVSEIRYFITKNKNEILDIFENKCEVCSFDFKGVLVVHHIEPVSEGGSNDLSNLSVLCPTCHSMVHKLMSGHGKENSRENFTRFDEWSNKKIPNEQSNKLIELSFGRRSD